MKHDFPQYGLGKLCGLFGKTRVAIYDYQKRLQQNELQDEIILHYVKQIRVILPRLGTRKLHIKIAPRLAEHNITMGRDYLFELLAQYGLLIRQRKRKVITTNSRHWMRKYANQLRNIIISRPEQVWVSDITFIRLNNQWGYLSLITDAYSRKIMGYCFRTDMSAQGCVEALQMGLSNRQYPDEPLIHHSDRGSQYCSNQYVELLVKNNIAISMTENGDPYENALAERMNGIIKNEFNLYESNSGFDNTYEKIRAGIKAYNEERPHSSCDMMTPLQAHQLQGELQKRWKKYPVQNSKESSKKEATPAPFTEQGDASFLTVNHYPLSLKTPCIVPEGLKTAPV
jgi:transposase InsO family protein